MIEKPNYYAIIPAKVRYDKRLSDKAKLFYGEISALTNKNGICWASNDYFSTLYEMSVRTVTRIIKELSDLGYIRIEIIDGKARQICLEGIDKNVEGTLDKNVYHNNTSINNINNNKKIYKRENFEKFWKSYPKKQNKAKTEKWFEKYNPDEELMNTILESLNKFKKTKEWNKDNGQYIPMPTTWLNGRRWEDDLSSEPIEETEADVDEYIRKIMEERGKL